MTFTLGPLALQAAHLILLSAVIVAILAGNWAGRKPKVRVTSTVLDMLLAGLVAGRVVFVLTWFETYSKAPLGIFDIRDGGFTVWAALVAGAVFGAWRAARNPGLREPLVVAVLAGSMAWLISGAPSLLRMDETRTIPATALATVTGGSQTLPALANGRPMVVNLWATWCPPCRREMPVLAAAQRGNPGIVFAFVNQGEARATVDTYLNGERIGLGNVLLDTGKALGLAVGSTALPTTLFYAADGRLVDLHLGPLSAASLEAKLVQLRPAGN